MLVLKEKKPFGSSKSTDTHIKNIGSSSGPQTFLAPRPDLTRSVFLNVRSREYTHLCTNVESGVKSGQKKKYTSKVQTLKQKASQIQ